MNKTLLFLFLSFAGITFSSGQQNVVVIARCGGVDTISIPNIIDNDLDGMDDALEQKLLDYFFPAFIKFDNESCQGPALDGSGDSNLVVSHIYPYPQQYTFSNSPDSVLTHPVALVPKGGLVTGMIWYNALIKVNAALLYGKDCGLAGHTADVEGVNFSLKYTGPDSLAGWMYDTVMQHWMGGAIQTRSHAGTLCEQIETKQGLDTIYISPDKHGNYLTISGCGASFICNPGCGGIPSYKNVRPVNIGEPNASLITDLGTAYAGYAGEDPWSTANFLDTYNGNAGPIREKMLLSLESDFIQGEVISSHAQICAIYSRCFATGSTYSDVACNGVAYDFFGQALTQSGTYYHALTNRFGCDSTVALSLNVFPASSSAYSAAICNGSVYNFNGSALAASGLYYDTLTNTKGCDSVVQLNLQVNPVNSLSYNATICSGESYLFNGVSLQSSGLYIDTLVNLSGCDSVVSLALVVDTLPPVSWNSITEDTVPVDYHPILLTGATPAGGVYSGAGVAGNLFYPNLANPGINAVTYTYTDGNGCSDSVVKNFVVLLTGIKDVDADGIYVYPNPAKGNLQVVLPVGIHSADVSVFNAQAVLMLSETAAVNNFNLDISALPAGVYFVQIAVEGKKIMRRVLVQ